MADRKLSELTTATPAAADLVYLVDVSDTTDGPAGSSRKCTASALVSLAAGTTDHAALSNLGFSASGHTDFAGLAVANTFTVGGHTIATAKSVIALTITGASGQAADLFECKNSAGTTIFEVSALGVATAISFSGSGSGLTSIPQSGVTNLTTDLAAKQPLDGDLTALAALTGTDTIYYRSAASTWSAVTIGTGLAFAGGELTATGGGGGGAPDSAKYVTLATDGTLSQERVLTAGTAISITDAGAGSTVTVAVNDVELLAIAGLTSAADSVPYFTGSGTAALATVTAAARTVLDDTTVAAMVDTLGGASSTGTGGLVRATTPTLVTPILGTPTSGTLTNCTGLPQAGTVGLTTADSPQFAGINLGHASDTTLTRTGAGDFAVEGKGVYREAGTDVPVADGGTGASDAATARTNLGLGSIATQDADNIALGPGTIVGLTLLGIVDADSSHDLILACGSDLTATHSLTFAPGDADRVLTFTADAKVGGTNSGDVTLAGTPDYITISGQAITRALINLASHVTGDLPYANLTQGSALSVLGVTGNSTADVASIAAGTDGFVLRRSGTTLAFGTLAAGAFADGTIAPARVVFAADNRLLARSAGSAGNGQEIALSGSMRWRSNQPAGGGTMTTATDGATVTFDINTSNRQRVTLGGNRTLALSNDADGDQFTIVLTQDGGGSRTVTWWAGIKWPGGTVPTLTTTGGKHDVFSFLRLASGEYLGWPSLNH